MTEKKSRRLSAELDTPKADDEHSSNKDHGGDWICTDSDCANVNFAKRTSCNRCGKECPKKKKLGQEIGKAAAEKSRGLFSADDWQCNKCGNVNWARRQQCNMCNAPKFGDVEERTGYGGGYNDRGIVEYKERRDDNDEEYDEFGRRRKRQRVDSKDSKDKDNKSDTDDEEDDRIKKKDRKEAQEDDEDDDDDDEEEEEEEDEEEDLSKYDLSEWDDLEAAKKK